jgi:hypothetical protein
LRAELVEACAECSCHPTEFAAQALESVLAARRLPKVPDGKFGARIGIAEKREPERVAEKRVALAPLEIPTIADLASLDEMEAL